MIATKSMSMHEEHRYWESEISLWRDELRLWQQELAKAQDETKLLEQALEGHARVLRTHASALRLAEETFLTHEHEMAEYEKGGEGDALFEMAQLHSKEALRHSQHREAHQKLKQLHHTAIALWHALLKALDKSHTAVSSVPSSDPNPGT